MIIEECGGRCAAYINLWLTTLSHATFSKALQANGGTAQAYSYIVTNQLQN